MTLATGSWEPMEVLFVVSSSGSPVAADQAIVGLLEDSAHVVTLLGHTNSAPAGYETDYDLVLISESCTSSSIDTAFLSASIPVICMEGFYADAGGTAAWISANPSNLTAQTSVYYEDDTELHWAGETVDSAVTLASTSLMRFSGTTGAGFVEVVTDGSTSGGDLIVGVYPSGSTVYGGDTANANYVYLGLHSDGYTSWNTATEELFFSCIQWATGVRQVTVAATGANYTGIQAALDAAECENGIWRVIINESVEYNPSTTIDIDTANGTLDATHFIHLCVHPDHRHSGIAGTGHARVHMQANGHAFTIDRDFTVISDLEIKLENTQASAECVRVLADTNDVLFSRNIFWADGNTDAADQDGLFCSSWSADFSVDNCVFHGFDRAGIDMQCIAGSHVHTLAVDHCSFHDNGDSSGEIDGGHITSWNGGSTLTMGAYNCAFGDVYADGGTARPINMSASQTSGTSTVNGSHNAWDSNTNRVSPDYDNDNTTDWIYAAGGITEVTTTASAIIFSEETDNSAYNLTPAVPTGAGSNALLGAGTNRIGSEPDSRQDFSLDIARNPRSTTGIDVGAFQVSSVPVEVEVVATAIQSTNSGQANPEEFDFSLSLSDLQDDDRILVLLSLDDDPAEYTTAALDNGVTASSVTQRGTPVTLSTTGAATFSSEPTGTVEGDRLIALLHQDFDGEDTLTAATGWTKIGGVDINDGSDYPAVAAFYIDRGASAPSLAFGSDGSSGVSGVLYAVHGHDVAVAPKFATSVDTGSPATHTPPTVHVAAANAGGFVLIANSDGNATWTTPAAMVEDYEDSPDSFSSAVFASDTALSAGDWSPGAFTPSSTSSRCSMITVVVEPDTGMNQITTGVDNSGGTSNRVTAWISDPLSGTMPTTVTLSGTGLAEQNVIIVYQLRNVSTSSILGDVIENIRTVYDTGAGNGTSVTVEGSDTVTDNGSVVVAFVGTNSDSDAVGATPTGWTAGPGDDNSNISGWSFYRSGDSGLDPDITMSWTTSRQYAAFSFVIRPTGDGGSDGDIAGSTDTASGATGELSIAIPLEGSAGSASEATATISKAVPLSGSAESASEATADMAKVVPLAGSANAASDATGSLSGGGDLSGSAATASGATGELSATLNVAGSTGSTSGAEATPSLTVEISGSAAAASGARGSVSDLSVSGRAGTASEATATLSITMSVSGSADTASGAEGDLSGGSDPSFVQWRFTDPVTSDTYFFESNPTSGGTPGRSKNLVYQNSAANNRTLAYKRAEEARTVRVQGTLYSQAQLYALAEWSQKRYPITLQDDLERTFTIYIEGLDVRRKRTADTPYAHDYTLSYVVV